MSLRVGAVETLRLADHDYDRLEQQEHPEGKAGFKLDRLLDFLEAHAEEWADAAEVDGLYPFDSALLLLAALRSTNPYQSESELVVRVEP